MNRRLQVSRPVFALAVLALAAGCGAGAAVPVDLSVEVEAWVVEAGGYRRATSTFYVTCVPASQLSRDYSDRDRWRDVAVGREHAYAAEPGDPCPAGAVLDSYGGQR